MTTLTREQADSLRENLLKASVQCSERCLYQAAKWIAELASSLPNASDFGSPDDTDSDSPMRDDVETPKSKILPIFSTSDDAEESQLEAQEIGKYLLAKSYFDCREYDRCSAVFLPLNPTPIVLPTGSPDSKSQTPTKSTKGKGKAQSESPEVKLRPSSESLPRLSQKSLFLALYAKYMAGEKRKDEDSEMLLGPNDNGAIVNKELVSLGRSLESWFSERKAQAKDSKNQGWLEYLYGVILAKGNSESEAKDYLIRSVNLNPYNWSAWLELRDLLPSVEALRSIYPLLPTNILTLLFNLDASQSLYQTSPQTHDSLTSLLAIFPHSTYLLTQRALLHYHSKDYETSESLFSSILSTSPHSLDSLDHYSNLLYVMSNRPKLAFLAHLATTVDKFRPETCCVVGNYYSLASEHEKAVIYFRRALTLDRTFLSAWTLMGHEYIELKNTHAAIASYRRAVDINRRDYRAWYGLGQTYEVLEMHHYALYYFQRAAGLRPYDRQMWQALGACYEKLEQWGKGIQAYKRALVSGMAYLEPSSSFGSTGSGGVGGQRDVILDPELLFPIALLYEQLGDMASAAKYMDLVLAQEEGPSGADVDGGGGDAGGGGGGAGEEEEEPQGTGVTLTTSKARLWLARWCFQQGHEGRALELANELCEDGYEVEEAKALVRDLRSRIEVGGGGGGRGGGEQGG
ncbi:MAG: hypothetical protein Q9222_005555 [Ikaeria aurantiellina]